MASHEQRIIALEAAVTRHESQLVGLRGDVRVRRDVRDRVFTVAGEGFLAAMDSRFDAVERRLAEQGQEFDRQFPWLVAIFITQIVGILTTLLRSS